MKDLALLVLGTLLFGLSTFANVLVEDVWLSTTIACFGGAAIGWSIAKLKSKKKVE